MPHAVEEIELRKYALSEATKAYKSGFTSASSGGGSLPAHEVVQRAKAYYDFLKGEDNG